MKRGGRQERRLRRRPAPASWFPVSWERRGSKRSRLFLFRRLRFLVLAVAGLQVLGDDLGPRAALPPRAPLRAILARGAAAFRGLLPRLGGVGRGLELLDPTPLFLGDLAPRQLD